METAKAGQPVSVKVASVQVAEVKDQGKKEEIDPLLAVEDSEPEVNLVEEPLGEEGTDEDDIFSGDDVFVAPRGNEALAALEDADLTTAETLEGAGEEESQESVTSEESGVEESGTFQIFSFDCLRCTHLVPDLKSNKFIKARAFTKCHHENGNNECPAKDCVVVVGIPIDKVVKSYMDAYKDGDHERLARISARLSTKDEGQKQLAHQAIERALRSHLLKKSAS